MLLVFQQLSPALFGAVCIIYEISLICKTTPLDWLSWCAAKALINDISAWLPGPTAMLGLEQAGGSGGAGSQPDVVQRGRLSPQHGAATVGPPCQAGAATDACPATLCFCQPGTSLDPPFFSPAVLPSSGLFADKARRWHCIFQAMIWGGLGLSDHLCLHRGV